MPNNQNKLLIGIPTMGDIHTILVSRLLHWTKKYDLRNYYFSYHVTPHDRARNEITKFFLDGDFTHLLFIDSDTLPPLDMPEKLLAHDLPFVTAMTPIVNHDHKGEKHQTFDNCFLEPVRNDDGSVNHTYIAKRDTGLQKIYRCGAACMLVRRDVFEALKPPYFRFEYNEDRTHHTKSEDIYFIDKVREAGFELYADTSVICKHQKAFLI